MNLIEEIKNYRNILETLKQEGGTEIHVHSHSGDDYIAPNQKEVDDYRAAVKAKDWKKVLHYEETWDSEDLRKAKRASKVVEDVNTNKESIHDAIQREMRVSKKMKNATRLYFYLWLSKKDLAAFTGYEEFINSWAGKLWFERNLPNIMDVVSRESKMGNVGWKIDEPKEYT